MHIFLARGLRAGRPRATSCAEHEEADMEIMWVPFDDLLAAVPRRAGARTGRVVHGRAAGHGHRGLVGGGDSAVTEWSRVDT